MERIHWSADQKRKIVEEAAFLTAAAIQEGRTPLKHKDLILEAQKVLDPQYHRPLDVSSFSTSRFAWFVDGVDRVTKELLGKDTSIENTASEVSSLRPVPNENPSVEAPTPIEIPPTPPKGDAEISGDLLEILKALVDTVLEERKRYTEDRKHLNSALQLSHEERVKQENDRDRIFNSLTSISKKVDDIVFRVMDQDQKIQELAARVADLPKTVTPTMSGPFLATITPHQAPVLPSNPVPPTQPPVKPQVSTLADVQAPVLPSNPVPPTQPPVKPQAVGAPVLTRKVVVMDLPKDLKEPLKMELNGHGQAIQLFFDQSGFMKYPATYERFDLVLGTKDTPTRWIMDATNKYPKATVLPTGTSDPKHLSVRIKDICSKL